MNSHTFFPLLLYVHTHIQIFSFKGIEKGGDKYLVIRKIMCVRDSLSICTAAVCARGCRYAGCDCCLLSHFVAFLER